ncbi:MAG: ubiquinone/menaquinone biosynthesis methyltransferase [Verrucomicrobia bacterium]|nr:ubiquinone/menaquinone biosynthesis methyltransferase [Verrucomicrobiota bacterium]
MANKFYVPGAARAQRVSDLFARIAPRYDLINDLQSLGLHRRWKHRLLRLADVRAGERALDVCCGTGDLSFALASAGARVTGVDFSAPMLAAARRRQETRRTGSVEFVLGDSLQLPLPDDAFDVVTIGYGLRNLADLERGLAELHRVTRPGGRILALDFGKPTNALWRACYFGYLRWIIPALGKMFCGDAQTHAYILESLQHYPGQHAVAELMRRLHLTNVQIVNLLGGAMSINYGEKPV